MAYSFTRSITIDHTKCGSTNSTNFAFLFYGVYNGTGGEPDLRTVANGGDIQNTVSAGGVTVPADLIFASDSGGSSLLDWEVVSYDATTGEVVVWIRISTLDSGTDTVIYMLYGDVAVVTWQGDINGTWNSSYEFMIHGSNVTTDSTSNARNFNAPTSPLFTTGKFGTCMRCTGDAQQVPSRSDAGLPSGTSDRTIKLWIAWTDNTIGETGVWGYGSFGGQDQRMRQSGFTGGSVLKYIKSGDDITYTFNPTINQFYYIVVTFNSSGTVAKIYVDGAEVASATKSGWNTSLGGTVIVFSDGFNITEADIQDFGIRDVVESPDEILAAYNNQNSPSTFYTISDVIGGDDELMTRPTQLGNLGSVRTF